MGLVNKVMEILMKKRMEQIQSFIKHPIKTQEDLLFNNLLKASGSVYGKEHGFTFIDSYQDFQNNVPIVNYETFEPYIERARKGEKNISWYGNIKWFAKSSGTTNAKSKFIPISDESLNECHYTAGKMMFAIYLNNHPQTNIFKMKNLRIGGSSELYQDYNTSYGDLSAILIDNLPFWAELVNRPNRKVSLMGEWESKLKAITESVITENIGSLTGVPSWMLVLLNNVLEYKNLTHLDDLWNGLEVFFHGGISFKPYIETYNNLTRNRLNYYEIYNASEGFFAIQDQSNSKDLLLLLDNGIFYEFIPMETFNTSNQKAIPLQEVEMEKNYAMVISTNGGLWRYLIGDTVRFTSKNPYRIIITGRTKHYINAFGEELIIENAEEALQEACKQTNALIHEYTAAPVFMKEKTSGAHEWIIEFKKEPNNIQQFTSILDGKLKELNSDYEAKRYLNMTLGTPKINIARKNLFFDWMKERGKLGGQNKVPRLSNDRTYIEPLIQMNKP